MDSRFNNQNEPLCRFGPGGDFAYGWSPKNKNTSQMPGNPLSRILETITQLIMDVLGPDFASYKTPPANTKNQTHNILNLKGNLKYADNQINPPANAIIKLHSKVQCQPMLFSDDSRISIKTANKPKHRIRTHRRTAKKRVSVGITGQGTLFEDNVKSAKTA